MLIASSGRTCVAGRMAIYSANQDFSRPALRATSRDSNDYSHQWWSRPHARSSAVPTGSTRLPAAPRSRAEEALAEVARWLADGRTYLVGDSFTAADLAFASLAAPLVCAPQYGGAMPPYDSLPAPMRSDIERLRASRSGAFVLELYARERAKSQRGHTLNRNASQ